MEDSQFVVGYCAEIIENFKVGSRKKQFFCMSDHMLEFFIHTVREAFIRKKRKKFGVLPNWGYSPPPFSEAKKVWSFPGGFFRTFFVVLPSHSGITNFILKIVNFFRQCVK